MPIIFPRCCYIFGTISVFRNICVLCSARTAIKKSELLTVRLKVVCRLELTIWSYWHGCRKQIFLNISNASNSMETP